MNEKLEQVRLLEGPEFDAIRARIETRLTKKVRDLISGSDDDNKFRGEIAALEWMLRLSNDIRREIQDECPDPDGDKEQTGAENG